MSGITSAYSPLSDRFLMMLTADGTAPISKAKANCRDAPLPITLGVRRQFGVEDVHVYWALLRLCDADRGSPPGEEDRSYLGGPRGLAGPLPARVLIPAANMEPTAVPIGRVVDSFARFM
jgi:hypothetical protein